MFISFFYFFIFSIFFTNSLFLRDEVGVLHSSNTDSDKNNLNFRRSILTSPNILSTSDKQALLDAHNLWRSAVANGSTSNQPKASNMNYLFWDDALAKTASDYAKKCLWTHNGNRVSNTSQNIDLASFEFKTTLGVGENLYLTSANSISSISSLTNGVYNWYDEYKDYTYSTSYQSAAGHYTQVVWANTRYVGCGYYQCPSVTVSGDTGYYSDGAVILVCNYYPAGNWGGQYPYKSGTACSQCDPDRTKCVNFECGGCLSSSYNYDNDTVPDDCDNGLGVDVNVTITSPYNATYKIMIDYSIKNGSVDYSSYYIINNSKRSTIIDAIEEILDDLIDKYAETSTSYILSANFTVDDTDSQLTIIFNTSTYSETDNDNINDYISSSYFLKNFTYELTQDFNLNFDTYFITNDPSYSSLSVSFLINDASLDVLDDGNDSENKNNNGGGTSGGVIAAIVIICILLLIGLFFGLNYKYQWIQFKNPQNSNNKNGAPLANTSIMPHAITVGEPDPVNTAPVNTAPVTKKPPLPPRPNGPPPVARKPIN